MSEDIRLTDEDSGFVVDICKQAHSSPVKNKFKFKIRNFPNIENSITKIAWNSVDKKLELQAEENAEFDISRWIQYINKTCIETETSPFIDVDSNCATLILMDCDDVSVYLIKFKNLNVINHEILLDKKQTTENLNHSIRLGYQQAEFKIVDNEQDNPKIDPRDAEWQKVVIFK